MYIKYINTMVLIYDFIAKHKIYCTLEDVKTGLVAEWSIYWKLKKLLDTDV